MGLTGEGEQEVQDSSYGINHGNKRYSMRYMVSGSVAVCVVTDGSYPHPELSVVYELVESLCRTSETVMLCVN